MGVDATRAVLVGFGAAVVVALLVAAGTSGSSFGAYNPSWDGTAELRSMGEETGTQTELAESVRTYRTVPPAETVAIVLAPADGYEQGDSAAVREFVQDGGTLLVAEDFGQHGNGLLADVGAAVRFDGAALRDERNYGDSPAFPVVSAVSDRPATAGVEELVFNDGTAVTTGQTDGTAVENATNATVLIESSSYSYLDRDGDGALDDDESIGTRPVAAVEPVGDGRVIAVGDPSVFVNAMLDRGDNRAFVRALYESHDRVVLDASQARQLPPLVSARRALVGSETRQAVVGGLALALVLGWRAGRDGVVRLRRRLGRDDVPQRALDRQAVVAGIRDRHPEWDEDAVERVTGATMSQRRNNQTDD